MIYAQDKPEGARVRARRFSRFRLAVFRGVEQLCRALGGRHWYRLRFLARGRFLMRHEELEVQGLPAALDGFTLAQLSDLHAGPFMRRGDLSAVVEAVNARDVDLIAMTGDFVTHEWSEALFVLDDLAKLRSRHGSFAVFGNHDYKHRQEHRIEAAYRAQGIRFLRNAHAVIRVGDAQLAVTGLEDLEEGKHVDIDAARRGIHDMLEICLCHNPAGAPALARNGCRVILSGHTHGGQVDLPWLRTLGPKHPGLRIELGATTLLVSRGLGVVGLPLRFGAPPEVLLVTLRRPA
ncbi:MAG: putative MPP superfamily phosphohydrolase [Planctomycetota bacterium]